MESVQNLRRYPSSHIPTMRRWFVILLAVLLSVQFGWAAAATYCAHEAGDAALSHFGHHAGTHADTPSKSVKPDELQKAQTGQKSVTGDQTRLADLDHGHCHLAQVAMGHDADLQIDTNNERGAHYGGEPLRSSHIPDGLDRPDWLRA